MIFRILIVLLIVGGVYYLLRNVLVFSDYKNCGKCDGKGYWVAMRGEKDKCDVCKGSGKIPKKA